MARPQLAQACLELPRRRGRVRGGGRAEAQGAVGDGEAHREDRAGEHVIDRLDERCHADAVRRGHGDAVSELVIYERLRGVAPGMRGRGDVDGARPLRRQGEPPGNGGGIVAKDPIGMERLQAAEHVEGALVE